MGLRSNKAESKCTVAIGMLKLGNAAVEDYFVLFGDADAVGETRRRGG